MSRHLECLSDDNAPRGDGHDGGSEEFKALFKQFFDVFMLAAGLTLVSSLEGQLPPQSFLTFQANA
eukprot:2653348-Prorocentrum_lima.AAC.1